MLASLLTAWLWSLSAVAATRGARLIGSVPFNLLRLLLAVALLAVWSHWLGSGLSGGWAPWFVLSGVIGFGLGDIAGYSALVRLGTRLSMLVVHCLAMPVGAIVEWLWLGTKLTFFEVSMAVLILVGVAVASTLPKELERSRTDIAVGVFVASLAAVGQALGAVVSRKAYAVAEYSGAWVDAGTATYQRTLGGVSVLLIAAALFKPQKLDQARDWKAAPRWIVIHTLTGPVVGVACFQWALSTTPAGLVLPVLATIPLFVMPLAYLMENEKPSKRSLFGGLVAVAAAAALAAVR